MKTESRLEKVLASGQLAVTSEVGPPRGCNLDVIKEKANMIKDYVDGINITDNQTAVVRMSSIAGGIALKQMGLDPIIQMVSRDRNRIAMQSDILGAYALGCNTMLCLSGDHTQFGDHPMAKPVYDIDSINMIKMVKDMRDEAKFQGEKILRKHPKCSSVRLPTPLPTPLNCVLCVWPRKLRLVWTSSRPSVFLTWISLKRG